MLVNKRVLSLTPLSCQRNLINRYNVKLTPYRQFLVFYHDCAGNSVDPAGYFNPFFNVCRRFNYVTCC